MTTKYGSFEGCAACWNGDTGKAFVAFDNKTWHPIHIAEVQNGAGMMSEDSYKLTYPDAPEIPKEVK